MREIKFRAWDDGRMVRQTGALVILKRFFRVIREDSILMQFTGLHDKNGKEIYEGDIVNAVGSYSVLVNDFSQARKYVSPSISDNYKTVHGVFPFVVEWNNTMLCYDFKNEKAIINSFINGRQHEVIGNIHENPELLNKEQGDPVSDTTAAE